MADTLSTADIIARARERADMAPSDFVADSPELIGQVNALASELYGLLLEARGQEYYAKTREAAPLQSQADLSVDQSKIKLPEDFLQLLAVRIGGPGYATVSDGREINFLATCWENIRVYQPNEKATFRGMKDRKEDPVSACQFAYRLGGADDQDFQTGYDVLNLWPVVFNAQFLIEFDYVPTAYFNTSGTDDPYIDGVNRWWEWIVWRLAASMLAKEQSDTSYCDGQAARIEARIRALAPLRDAGRPEVAVGRRRRGHARGTGWWPR